MLAAPGLDAETRKAFDRECHALGSLSAHPNIVTLYRAGVAGGRPFMVMEYMPKGSIAARLPGQPLPWTEALTVGVKLAGALAAAHTIGILHRDIKPENILVTAYDEPQLADFGVARIQGGTRTATGVITGSIKHAAPEVLSGVRAAETSDVWALGSTLHTLIAGVAPFEAAEDESLHPLITRILTAAPADLRPFGVPDAVCEALEAALQKDSWARPEGALPFGTMLQRVQRGLGLPVTPIVASTTATALEPADSTTSEVKAMSMWSGADTAVPIADSQIARPVSPSTSGSDDPTTRRTSQQADPGDDAGAARGHAVAAAPTPAAKADAGGSPPYAETPGRIAAIGGRVAPARWIACRWGSVAVVGLGAIALIAVLLSVGGSSNKPLRIKVASAPVGTASLSTRVSNGGSSATPPDTMAQGTTPPATHPLTSTQATTPPPTPPATPRPTPQPTPAPTPPPTPSAVPQGYFFYVSPGGSTVKIMGSRGGINGVYNIVIGSAAWIGWNGQFATRTITLALSALADLANDASMVSRSIVITPADVNAHWVSAHVGALYIRIGVPQNIQNQNGTQYFIVGAKDTISMFAYDHFCCSGDAVR